MAVARARTGRGAVCAGLLAGGLVVLPAAPVAADPAVNIVGRIDVTSPGHLQVRFKGNVKDQDPNTGSLTVRLYVHDGTGRSPYVRETDSQGNIDVTLPSAQGGPTGYDVWVLDELPGGGPNMKSAEPGAQHAGYFGGVFFGGPPIDVMVDRTAPTTSITSWPASPFLVEAGTTRPVRFTFAANEAGSSFTCSLDAAGVTTRDWKPCASGVELPVGVGEWEFRVRAKDPAGNQGAEAVHRFSVAPGSPTDPGTGLPVGGQVSVQAAAVKKKSKLRVRVRPGSAEVDFRFVVQKQVTKKRKGKKAKKVWKQVRKSVTRKAGEQRVLNLPKGRYRVVVPAQHGMAKARSKAVRLKR